MGKKEDRDRANRMYEAAIGDVTTEDILWLLTDRYAEPVIPPCRICGAELSLQRAGGGEPIVYRCVGQNDDRTWKEGRTPADDHYSRSEFKDYRQGGDSFVMELIERFKRATGR